ncbi:MAG: VOC family protein, partial [Candidatus Competibacteraceae bacterium]|nr:VOC family protein [Candidatus Competibacteraceae bacterium]
MQIQGIDHIVLTARDLTATLAFYQDVLGMRVETFGKQRKALIFGQQKINLHQQGQEFEPKAALPTPGSQDLCFIATTPLSQVIAHLQRCEVAILEGPVVLTGATGTIRFVYFRDPDV